MEMVMTTEELTTQAQPLWAGLASLGKILKILTTWFMDDLKASLMKGVKKRIVQLRDDPSFY